MDVFRQIARKIGLAEEYIEWRFNEDAKSPEEVGDIVQLLAESQNPLSFTRHMIEFGERREDGRFVVGDEALALDEIVYVGQKEVAHIILDARAYTFEHLPRKLIREAGRIKDVKSHEPIPDMIVRSAMQRRSVLANTRMMMEMISYLTMPDNHGSPLGGTIEAGHTLHTFRSLIASVVHSHNNHMMCIN